MEQIQETRDISSEPNSRAKENLKVNLEKINWDRGKIKIYGGYSNSSHNNYGWGNWSSNPYSSFFENEASWKKEMESIHSSVTRLEDYKDNFWGRLCGVTIFPFATKNITWMCTPFLDTYSLDVEKKQSIISLTVGKKLLKEMSQLEKS